MFFFLDVNSVVMCAKTFKTFHFLIFLIKDEVMQATMASELTLALWS